MPPGGRARLSGRSRAGAANRTGSTIPLAALVDGYQLAFWVGAGLIAFGAALMLALVRRRDVASISPEQAMAAAAA
jgi:hypothetical protein